MIEKTAWKVEFMVMKNRHGNYENGGNSYFRTIEEAEAYIDEFKKNHDGWTSDIKDPEEVPIEEADLD